MLRSIGKQSEGPAESVVKLTSKIADVCVRPKLFSVLCVLKVHNVQLLIVTKCNARC